MLAIRIAAGALLALCSAAASAAGEVYKWTDDEGRVHYTDAPPDGRDYERIKVRGVVARADAQPEADAPAAEAKPAAPTRQSNCEIAKKNLETFRTSTAISMDRDGDGTPEPLDDAERAKELARNEELARLLCEGE